MMEYSELAEKAGQYLPEEKMAMVRSAYEFAASAHEGQMRKSGGPFIEHPLEIAGILADLQMDAAALTAALLHDVPEDSKISLDTVREKFGLPDA